MNIIADAWQPIQAVTRQLRLTFLRSSAYLPDRKIFVQVAMKLVSSWMSAIVLRVLILCLYDMAFNLVSFFVELSVDFSCRTIIEIFGFFYQPFANIKELSSFIINCQPRLTHHTSSCPPGESMDLQKFSGTRKIRACIFPILLGKPSIEKIARRTTGANGCYF